EDRGGQQEADRGVDERPVHEPAAVDLEVELAELRDAAEDAQQRGDEPFGERGDQVGEDGADDHGDRQLHQVPLEQELLEAFHRTSIPLYVRNTAPPGTGAPGGVKCAEQDSLRYLEGEPRMDKTTVPDWEYPASPRASSPGPATTTRPPGGPPSGPPGGPGPPITARSSATTCAGGGPPGTSPSSSAGTAASRSTREPGSTRATAPASAIRTGTATSPPP